MTWSFNFCFLNNVYQCIPGLMDSNSVFGHLIASLTCKNSNQRYRHMQHIAFHIPKDCRASLIGQLVKNPPAMQETQVGFLGQEDPLEKGIGYPLQHSWASLVAQLVENLHAVQEPWVWSWVEKIPRRRERLPVFWPGEFHGFYSLWSCKESGTTEWLSLSIALTCNS